MDLNRHRSARLLGPLLVLALIPAGCGDDDDGAAPDDSTTTVTSTTAAPTTSETTEPPTTTESTTTTEPPATTTTVDATTTTTAPTGPVPEDELPGEAFDLTPGADETLAVVGVRFDDVLNVRRIPGTDGEIVTTLAPTAADFVATGRARMLTRSIWWEVVTADGVTGWVSSAFTAKIGPTFDTTAAVIDELGYTPEEATMSDLGLLVLETVDRDPDLPFDFAMSVEADETGDLGEVTFDLVGLGDDAVRGVRVHVFGEPLPSGDGFSLRSVEQTDMCDSVRGPSEPGGLCA